MNLNPVTLLVVNSLCKITAHYLDFLLDLSINPGDNLSRPILDCYPIRKYGTKRRSCNPSWYKQYRWLEYSSERNCVPVITFKVVSHMLIRPSPPTASLIGSMLLERLELLQSMISVIHIGNLC